MKGQKNTLVNITQAQAEGYSNDVIIANAQNVYGKKYAIIPVSEIDIDPAYQRKQKDKSIMKLARGWDEELYDPIKVTYREGRFKVNDGGHRLLAQIANGRKNVVCQICGKSTLQDEATRFVRQDALTTKLKPIDTFKANIVIGEPVDTAIKRICDANMIAIPKNGTSYNPNTLCIR